MQGLPTGPHHIQLTWGDLVSVPRPVAAEIPGRTVLDLGEKPQRARRRHTQAQRVGAEDALPSPALLLPQTIEGIGVADCNFYRPAVAVLAQDGVDAQGEVGGEKRLDRRERFTSPRRVEAASGIAPHNDDPDEASGQHGVP